ncbi:OsmC family protein [Ramlibacter sp.]|uniref:OsmC family protein n=1 Tax=Ramlibacter sp. TaxID=1917967 RepID=UPI002D080BB0|nr:OsmC family protein [Ramlibacter sp.]HWI83721.1 OsmC family protein [Ramlibacter sp.]
MHPLPHHYHAQARGGLSGSVAVTTTDAPALDTHAPPEFGGPGGAWSPESLLVASIADCYILSFRAVARASKLEWAQLEVDVEGVLDRVDGVMRFARYIVRPRLSIVAAEQETLARAALEKAKRACLITNSLNGECELVPSVGIAEAVRAAP